MSDVLGPCCTRCAGLPTGWVGGVNATAAVGLCTTQDLVMKYVLVQLLWLLVWQLLRSLACAAQCSSTAHMLRWLLQLQDDALVGVCIAAGGVE